jgi:alpha-tubulin suppressor-like RCC1 family protein
MNCCLYVKTDGSLWGIGSAMNGCFGQGSAEAWNTYSQPHHIADNVASVSAGRYATLYLTTGGDLYGMGKNSGTIVPKSADLASSYTTPVLMETGVSACQIGEYSSYYLKSGTLYRVSSKNNVKTSKVVAENVTNFSIQWVGSYDADKVWFTKSDGSLWAWGSNLCGSLGTGNLANISTPVKIVNGSVASVLACSKNNYYITTRGVLMGTGTVSGGYLGNRNEDFNVTTPRLVATNVSAACGSVFTFVLTNGGILQGLGGYDGVLQFGRTASQAYSLAPWQIATGVTEIAANTYHGLYVRNGVLYGVGDNTYSNGG